MALADRLDRDAARADPLRVEERLERLAHQERRELELGRLLAVSTTSDDLIAPGS